MEEQEKRNRTYSAERYLLAAINMGDWISAEYKGLVDKHKGNDHAIRQIYLCACDNVPIEMLSMVSNKEPIEDSFRKVREEYLRNKYSNMHASEVEEIRLMVEMVRKDVKYMSRNLKQKVDVMPSAEDTHFPSEPTESTKDVSEAAGESLVSTHKIDTSIMESEKEISKWKFDIKNIFTKKRQPIKFIDDLSTKGYTDEQIEFVINCLEEGLSEEEIKKFISPKLDVENMKRLKKLYGKGE